VPLNRDILLINRGVDQSLPAHVQREGSLGPATKNVRLLPPHTRRAGIGKRPGLVLAFLNAVGQAAPGPRGIPITGAARCIRAANQTVNLDGNYINVDDDFTQYAVPNVFGGTFYTGTNFRGRYVVFAHKDTGVGAGDEYAKKNPSTGVYPNAPYVPALSTDPRSPGRELRITSAPVSTTDNYGLAINYRTTNRVKATIKILAAPFGNTGADFPTPGTGQCTNLAVFVRGSETLGNFVCAYLKATGTDTVQLVIEEHNGGTLTTHTSATTHSLARTAGPSVLSLEVIATATAVSARVVWGDQGIDETFTVTTTTLASEDRAGLILRHTGSSIYRTVTRLEYTTLVPLEKVVKYSIRATDADPTAGRWQIPKGWDSIYLTDSTIQGRYNLSASYSENGARPTVEYPTIDRIGVSPASGAPAEAQIYGGLAASESGSGGVNNGGTLANVTRFMIPSDYASDTFVNALANPADVEVDFTDTDGAIDDSVGVALRIDGIMGTYDDGSGGFPA
jgi:hypothetical protein